MTTSERATEALAALPNPEGMTEYAPVERAHLAPWTRMRLYLMRGHRRTERRIWVGQEGSEILLVDAELFKYHCANDAMDFFNTATLPHDILPSFTDLNLTITDDTTGRRTFTWSSGEFAFKLVRLPAHADVLQSISIAHTGHEDSGRSVQLLREMQATVSARGNSRLCLSRFWNVLAFIATGVGVLGSILLAVRIAYEAGLPDRTPWFAGVAVALFWMFPFVAWSRRRYAEALNDYWRRQFTQGDHDGSIRRALESVGVTLSPPRPEY